MAVVDKLEIALIGEAPHAVPIDSKAYDLYLQALYITRSGGPKTEVDHIGNALEKAVEIEPDFADAWAELGMHYLASAESFGSTNHEGDARWQQGLDALERVASIEPDHPMLLIHSAMMALDSSDDYSTAARFLERAIEKHPQNLSVLRATTRFAELIRRRDLAVVLSRVIVEREPLCSSCAYIHARTLVVAGRYEEAEQAILRYRNVLPGSGGELTLGIARLLAGNLDGAERAFSERVDEVGRRYGDLLLRAARGENGTLLDEIADFSQQETYSGHAQIAHTTSPVRQSRLSPCLRLPRQVVFRN